MIVVTSAEHSTITPCKKKKKIFAKVAERKEVSDVKKKEVQPKDDFMFFITKYNQF